MRETEMPFGVSTTPISSMNVSYFEKDEDNSCMWWLKEPWEPGDDPGSCYGIFPHIITINHRITKTKTHFNGVLNVDVSIKATPDAAKMDFKFKIQKDKHYVKKKIIIKKK